MNRLRSFVVTAACLLAACETDRVVAPSIVPLLNVQGSATTWTLSLIATPTSGGGVGQAILDNGLAVGRRGSAGFAVPQTGTGFSLPGLAGHSDAHTYDVALVNDKPIAVGFSGVTEGGIPSRAVYWRLAATGAPVQGAVDIGLPQGQKGAIARGINSRGDIVGYAFYNPGTFVAWMRTNTGVLSVINSIGVSAAVAEDINSSRLIVGRSTRTDGTIRGFRWPVTSGEFTVMQALRPLSGHQESHAHAVNDDGTIVGYSGFPGPRVAVKWVPGSVDPIDLGMGSNSEARDINAAGYVVVRRQSSGGGREIGVIHPDGTLNVLPAVVGSAFYEAWGINACGDVVGSGPTSAGQPNSMLAVRWKANPCLR